MKLLHAADLHLDSPLRGLDASAVAERILKEFFGAGLAPEVEGPVREQFEGLLRELTDGAAVLARPATP